MQNNCSFTGRLTADPKYYENDGTARVLFTLAVDRDKKDNERGYDTDFLDFIAWRNTAKFIHRFFNKGDMMTVSNARAQVRMYDDSEGTRHRKTEFVVDNVYFGQPKKRED